MDKITEIQARLAIEELFARYAYTIDGYDVSGWVNCFTANGVFEVAGEEDDGVRFTGHKQLTVFAQAHVRLLPGTRHVMTNHVIEFENEISARHKCVLSGTLSRPELVYVFASGWYESSVVLVNGDWKISHRKVYLDNAEAIGAEPLSSHMQPMIGWIMENGKAAL
jgi:3-phenylpropionate/cinnamic acid dioxygenase small subunit